jgi:hypothetical protein
MRDDVARGEIAKRVFAPHDGPAVIVHNDAARAAQGFGDER